MEPISGGGGMEPISGGGGGMEFIGGGGGMELLPPGICCSLDSCDGCDTFGRWSVNNFVKKV